MTKGILMFAINGDAKDPKFNTVHIDYIAMATANAKNIKTHMQNNKVALITNMEGKSLLQAKGYIQYFDHVVIIDADGQGVGPNTNPQVNTRAMRIGTETIRLPWKNQSRTDAYDLSPYDETLLLDSDYFVFDDMLDKVFNTDANILCGKHVEEMSYQDALIDYERLHHQSVKLFWATVLYFKKSTEAQMMFNIMKMVKKNWQYYGRLYKFDSSRTYRNDFAVSIALHMMMGKKENTEYDLPFTIMCLSDKNMLKDAHSFFYRYKNAWAGTGMIKQNMHIMNKVSAMQMAEDILNG